MRADEWLMRTVTAEVSGVALPVSPGARRLQPGRTPFYHCPTDIGGSRRSSLQSCLNGSRCLRLYQTE